jgi:hypothetical protein
MNPLHNTLLASVVAYALAKSQPSSTPKWERMDPIKLALLVGGVTFIASYTMNVQRTPKGGFPCGDNIHAT